MRNGLRVSMGLMMLVGAIRAEASVSSLNLTTVTVDSYAPSNSGTVNNAIFTVSTGKGGTGVFDPFLRMQSNGSEQGYNTSGSPVPFDDKSGTWTHDITLGSVSLYTDPTTSVEYFRFLLDINEDVGNGDSYLSLDKIQLYTSSTPSLTTTTVANLGTLRYDLDQGQDSEILLDYNRYAGSGNYDLEMLVPVWTNADRTDYLYLYSEFGDKGKVVTGSGRNKVTRDWTTSDGFEEWAVDSNGPFLPVPPPPPPPPPSPPPVNSSVPEPASLVGWSMLGLMGIAFGWTRRRRWA